MTDFKDFDPDSIKKQKPITIKLGDYSLTFPTPLKQKGASLEQVRKAIRWYSSQP